MAGSWGIYVHEHQTLRPPYAKDLISRLQKKHDSVKFVVEKKS